ncbi:hypothetical protein NQZ68_022182 [Dissostichus eleginoides]|nr:hypothetical protein NQZ68_022182 [Dissostichus eleginoides]
MSKRRYTTEEALELILSGGPLSDVDSSDSEADSWCDEEENDHGIDPFKDKNPEDERGDAQATVPISRPPSNREGKECGQEGAASRKRAKPMPGPLTVKGRGRGKGKETSLTPEEPGAVWNGPEVPDTAQQLPHFCPKRAPGVHGFVGVEYTPAQIFRNVFNNQAVNLICKNTNKNAEKEQAKGKKFVWEELKPVKFLIYILHKEMCLSSESVAMSHAQFIEELSAELCGVPEGHSACQSQCPVQTRKRRKRELTHLRDGGQETRQQKVGEDVCSAKNVPNV